MQTLWSRLASRTIQSCRCPSCTSGVRGVVRRPINAAGQKPKYAYSSTLFYSGIFAAAATADAVVKQKRRQQWDEAIAQVKEEIGGKKGEGREEGYVTYAPPGEEHLQPQALYEDERLARGYGAVWPTNTGIPLTRHNLPPQSEHALERRRAKAESLLWSTKKIRKLELNVDRLVVRMLLYLNEIGAVEVAAAEVPDDFRDFMRTPRETLLDWEEYCLVEMNRVGRLNTLLTGIERHDVHSHCANYKQHPDGSHLETAAELISAMKSIFHRDQANSLPVMLAKVCYNLSITSAPPTLPVWNCLVANLMKHCSDQAPVSSVISAICHSHIRMNEDTMARMLEHCRIHDDVNMFMMSVGRMRGLNGGIMLARPDINITESGASRLVRTSDGKVVQNPYPTPKVFEALIKGVLRFSGFEAALGVCRDMGSDGWGLSIRGLVHLLRDCVGRSDWETGQAVWRHMLLLKEKSRRDGRAERLPQAAYVEMLKMCSHNGDMGMFKEITQLARLDRHHYDQLLQNVVRAISGPEETKTASKGVMDKDDVESLISPKTLSPELKVLERDHLMGGVAATEELDDYEAGERPMHLHSSSASSAAAARQ